MNKKIIGVFLISLIGTLLCGVIITYPRWSVLIKNSSSKQVNETVINEEIASDDTDTVKIEMTYRTVQDYSNYNNVPCYLGTLDQAKAAGFDVDQNDKGFSGFPYFNSPIEVADAIEKAGFNVVLQSSNHTIDQGVEGLLYAYNVWKQHPNVLMVGIHENTEELHDIPVMEIEGIKFAILNYTYGPNLGAVPSNVQGHMNILCATKEGSKTGELDFTRLDPAVIDDIKRADEMADIVIVCPHWGTEYATEPSKYQTEFAHQMAEAGADLIIGAHPHVPEPVEKIETSSGKSCLCYYSLGNYI